MTPAAVPPGNWRAVMEAGERLASAVESDWFGDSGLKLPHPPYCCLLCDVTGYTIDDIRHEKLCAVTLARHFQAVKNAD